MTNQTSIRESRDSFKSYRQTRLPRRAAIICCVILLGTHLTAQAAILLVSNAADSGAGSLRQAILDSNASTGVLDTITFNIPGTGVQTIVPLTILPAITDPVPPADSLVTTSRFDRRRATRVVATDRLEPRGLAAGELGDESRRGLI